MEAHNRAKAALLYDYLDSQDFFSSPIDKNCRSLMNVPFRLRDATLDAKFLEGAQARGLVQLKGASRGRRHARLDLQRDADRRRAGAGGVPEGIRRAARLRPTARARQARPRACS